MNMIHPTFAIESTNSFELLGIARKLHLNKVAHLPNLSYNYLHSQWSGFVSCHQTSTHQISFNYQLSLKPLFEKSECFPNCQSLPLVRFFDTQQAQENAYPPPPPTKKTLLLLLLIDKV